VAWLARRPGPARAAILRSAATALTMAAGALAVGVLYTRLLRLAWNVVATRQWGLAAAFWHGHPIVGALATFVAWDLAGWGYHVIGHRTRLGWAAHQPHHSGEGYDATLGLRQSWAPFHGLAVQPLLALAGFDLRVVIVCAACTNCWQVLEHTSLPVRFPRWFEAHVMTPAAHRHHHGRDGGSVNMGPFFTWWDRLAGTWVSPDHPAPSAYGSPERPSANPVAIELRGWVSFARSHSSLSRRARRKVDTCEATRIGATNTHSENRPANRVESAPRQYSPSIAMMATHQPRARRDPRPARGARTKPNTTTDTAIPTTTRNRTRNSSSVPPSIDTDSASTSQLLTRRVRGRRPPPAPTRPRP
jgi:sterol desaturase/sphingolipid hydroxylase (fatty acid hydroxylase superfamily)